MSIKKTKRNVQTPSVVQEEPSVELPYRDAEEQPFPSIASLLSEMDAEWDPLSDGGQSTIPYDCYGLSDEILAEYLPPDCPGWGRYDTDNIVCALCPYNVGCMIAEDESTKPSREQ
jgi:hypothetical protein